MKKEIRAFIAVEINKDIRNELVRIQEELKKNLQGQINWVDPNNIHLTMRFLGHINQDQIEQIKKIIANIAKHIKKFNMDLGVIGAFPDITHPRVIWVGINFGFNQLNEINAQIEEQLEIINFEVGEKYFHPHLSIGRVKALKSKNELKELTEKIKPKQLPALTDRIVLFQSEITAQGAKYTKLFEAKLG